MTNLELQKLRDLPIEGVAERLGLRVSRHKSLCPFHDDSHPSLSFNLRKNTFRCFVCDAHGGTIDLVMRYRNIGFREACQWLSDGTYDLPQQHTYDLPQPLHRRGASTSAVHSDPSPCGGVGGGRWDASRYERFFLRPWLSPEAQHFLYEERKLDPRVVRWCRLTSWRDRNGIPWLQTPYYDQQGKLIGVQNRNLTSPKDSPTTSPNPSTGGEFPQAPSTLGSPPVGESDDAKVPYAPRFRFPLGSRCSIYNLPVLNRLRPGDELWITEGCSDCWAMLSSGKKAIAIPSATLLTPHDKELLRKLMATDGSSPLWGSQRGSIHMYPDRDAPGERLFLQLKEILPDLVHHQLPPDCKDFSDYYLRNRNDYLLNRNG